MRSNSAPSRNKSDQRLEQNLLAHFRLNQHLRRPASRHDLGIFPLMIVRRLWKRHQQRRLARRASSATVLAPLRASTRSAASIRRGISSRKRKLPTAKHRRRIPDTPPASSPHGARPPDAGSSIPEPPPARPAQSAASCVLKTSAPWLPPKTSRCRSTTGRRGRSAKNSFRTGIPVTFAFRKYSHAGAKLTAAALTRLPTSRFASPGAAFGSKASVGIRFSSAATIPGPEA